MSSIKKNANSIGYRPDIDGLRAIAVLSVIIFHIEESLIPGGFVGVDIFFVISGYLITQHIFFDLSRGTFSIVEFYRRRIKRIIPALLVVVAFTVCLAQFILIPKDAEKVAESGLWSLLSMANVYFWLFEDTSYFAAASDQKPLLHLWSLGVEEQFYIFWPLILLFTYRIGHGKYFFLLFSIFTMISFLYGEFFHSYAPSFVYYMLPTRAGELLVGALLAQFILKRGMKPIPEYLSSIISISGLCLIVWSFYFLSEKDVFPGLWAIPPTLGTAMIIFSGHFGKPAMNTVLSIKPLVWIGSISYSAYLWHWPLLAFYRYGYGEITLRAGVAIFCLTILLAWLSYLFIETPFRNVRQSATKVFVYQFIIPSGCIAFIALASMKLDGYGFRWFSEIYRLEIKELREENKPAYKYQYVCQSQRITSEDVNNKNCVIGGNQGDRTRVILWGDSNAAHFIGVLGAFAEKEGFAFRNLQIGSCPPIDTDATKYTSLIRTLDCNQSREIILNTIEQYDVLIISADWTTYQARKGDFLETFYAMLKQYVEDGKKIILLGKAPIIHSFDRLCREKAVSFPFVYCNEDSAPLDHEVERVNGLLREFSVVTENVEYFDFNGYLCRDGLCGIRDEKGKLIYFDSSHLSLDASWKLGERIMEKGGVPHPFSKIINWIEER